MFRRALVSAVSVFVCAQVHASTQSTPTSPLFPLIGGYLNSGKMDFGDASYATQIAKLNMVVLQVWPNFSSNNMNMEQTVQQIKKLNPNTVVFLYQDINELSLSPDAVWDPLLNAINTNHWWLYESGSGGTKVASSFGNGTYELNTTIAYPNSHYVDWRANWNITNFATPSVDGIFTDNVFWAPRVNGDWQQNGTSDSDTSATTRTWYRQGFQRYFNDMKAGMPGKYQAGNIADWGQTSSVLTEYNQMMQGGLMEDIIGLSWSFESQGFSQMMTAYQKMMNAIAQPQLVIFEQVGSATDYQGMRYGLASCLLGNAYFYYDVNSNSNGPNWFDEFSANLGAATSSPFPTAAYQKGVYRRDFANGIALVNPKGNGTQTITLEDELQEALGYAGLVSQQWSDGDKRHPQ